MNKVGQAIGVLGLLLSVLIFTTKLQAQPPSTSINNANVLELTSCHLKGIRLQVQCGTLQVPLDYEKPSGEKISIRFAILPAIDNSQSNPPMMFLAGGPGQAATELASTVRRSHRETLRTRDIILVDQRGTGGSAELKCDEFNQDNVYTSVSNELNEALINQCLAQINYDLAQFTTENAIRDFDAVRTALGLGKISVYGGSYGTRAALVYMRMFPDSLEAVVLDSVGPIEVPIGLFGQSAARSFQLMLNDCAADTRCNQAYPNVGQEFVALKARLLQQPVNMSITHPRLGTPTAFILDVDKLIANLRLQLYSVQGRSMLPLVIHEAYQENYMPMAGLISQTDGGIGVNGGLLMNIVCNEDYHLLTTEKLQNDANNDFGGGASHLIFEKVCPIWPKYQPSANFHQPINANIPTLILSGNLDPVTPPSNGELAHQSLPNSKHLIANTRSHIVVGQGCGGLLVAEFLVNKVPSSVAGECLHEIPKPAFMIGLNGGGE